MIISGGDVTTFLTRPLSLGLLLTAAVLLAVVQLPAISRRREHVFVDED